MARWPRIRIGYRVAQGAEYHGGRRLVWWLHDRRACRLFEAPELRHAIDEWRLWNWEWLPVLERMGAWPR